MKFSSGQLRFLRHLTLVVLVGLASTSTAGGQFLGQYALTYSFTYNDCPVPILTPDQLVLREIASEFIINNLECARSTDGLGTQGWPEDETIDYSKYVGFRLTAPDDQMISIGPTDTLKFTVYRGPAMEVYLLDNDGSETLLNQRSPTGEFQETLAIPIPTTLSGPSFEIRIHLAGPNYERVHFDDVELTFTLAEAVHAETPVRQVAESCRITDTYPNPTSGVIQTLVSPAQGTQSRVRLISPLGTIIRTWSLGPGHSQPVSVRWNASDLSSGVYLIELSCEENRSTSMIAVY